MLYCVIGLSSCTNKGFELTLLGESGLDELEPVESGGGTGTTSLVQYKGFMGTSGLTGGFLITAKIIKIVNI